MGENLEMRMKSNLSLKSLDNISGHIKNNNNNLYI